LSSISATNVQNSGIFRNDRDFATRGLRAAHANSLSGQELSQNRAARKCS
jgi:hypothetical protein